MHIFGKIQLDGWQLQITSAANPNCVVQVLGVRRISDVERKAIAVMSFTNHIPHTGRPSKQLVAANATTYIDHLAIIDHSVDNTGRQSR